MNTKQLSVFRFFLVTLLGIGCLVACQPGHAEPGEIKIGALIKMENTPGAENTSDLELVEFLNMQYEGTDFFSLNLGGSYKDESLGMAALLDSNGIANLINRVLPLPDFSMGVLDFEFGLYVSRQFDDQDWDVGICSTLFSHKF